MLSLPALLYRVWFGHDELLAAHAHVHLQALVGEHVVVVVQLGEVVASLLLAGFVQLVQQVGVVGFGIGQYRGVALGVYTSDAQGEVVFKRRHQLLQQFHVLGRK